MSLPSPLSVRYPPPLQAGDRVALFAPASHQGKEPPERIQQALSQLRIFGLVVGTPPESTRYLYLAGTDQERAADFQRLYLQPDIKALFATRGGWGSARMLDYLDATALLKAPPKHVIGMSDITALLCWLRRYAALATLHAPCVATTQLMESPDRDDNLAQLRQALFQSQPARTLDARVLYCPPSTPPLIKGELTGGCLSVLAAGMGTPWQPHTKKTLLFLEDTDEAPYRLDRYLTQLRQAGVFEDVSAVLLGHFQNCDTPPPTGLLKKLWQDAFQNAPFPIIYQLPAGHGSKNYALPLGRTVTIKVQTPKPEEHCTVLC